MALRSFVQLALLCGLVLLVSRAAAQTKEEVAQMLACQAANNNCEACMADPACGFCGVFPREGWCVTGTESGSQLAPFGIAECPEIMWRFDDCASPVRDITVDQTSDKITWTSQSVSGSTSATARYDGLQYIISTEPGDDNETRAGFGVFYGSAPIGADIIDWEAHVVAFDSIIEYTPSSPGAPFECQSVGEDNWRACPGVLSAVKFYPLRDWQQLSASSNSDASVFTGTATSAPDATMGAFEFGLECTTGSRDFTVDNKELTPYEMKCDISIDNWPFAEAGNQLALVTFIASASASSDDEGNTVGEPRLKLGDRGFFQWETEADGNGVVGSVGVDRNEVLFRDEVSKLDPNAPVFATFFSFDTSSVSGGVTSILWDPELGIQPVEVPPVEADDGGNQLVLATSVAVVAVFSALSLLL